VHDGARAAAFQLALAARAGGLRAELELGGRSLKGQFKHAERLNARFVAVVENQSVSLRDRERGTERTLGAAEVVGQVQRDLGA
jgi:histidyl-tRNA synthetase